MRPRVGVPARNSATLPRTLILTSGALCCRKAEMLHVEQPVDRITHKRDLIRHIQSMHPELIIHIGPPLHKRTKLELDELHRQLHKSEE